MGKRLILSASVLVMLSLTACSSQPTEDKVSPEDISPTTVKGDSTRQAQDWAGFLARRVAATADSSAIDDDGAEEFALLRSERIGGIFIGMESAEVDQLLGTADIRGEITYWDADACDHQDWQWPRKGISLNMEHCGPRESWKVFMVNVQEGCEFSTQRGIHLGSTYEEVMAAYADEVAEEFSGQDAILAGSLYGGVSFGLENGKVIAISMGAFAE